MAAGVPDYSYILDQYVKNIQRKAEAAVKRVIPAVNREWYRMVDEKLRQSYKETIAHFYASYSPQFYHRSRSLYQLLETEIDDESMSIQFNPANMTPYRNGYSGEDGLYDLVFRHGWHGGARSGDYTSSYRPGSEDSGYSVAFTPHPNPGTPHYRRPYPYYGQWGAEAVKSESPLENFKLKVAEYESDPNGAQGDYYRAWSKYQDQIVIRL